MSARAFATVSAGASSTWSSLEASWPHNACDGERAESRTTEAGVAIVIDRDALMRLAAGELICRELNCGEAVLVGSLAEARIAMRTTRARFILADAALLGSEMTSSSLRAQLDAEGPIVVFVDGGHESHATKWFEAGADAVLDRRVDQAGFCEAMRLAARGERFCMLIDTRPREPWINYPALERRADNLRPRQRDILRLIASGARNREIALALRIREPTVKAHVCSTLRYLRVVNRTRAAICAKWLIGRGLL